VTSFSGDGDADGACLCSDVMDDDTAGLCVSLAIFPDIESSMRGPVFVALTAEGKLNVTMAYSGFRCRGSEGE